MKSHTNQVISVVIHGDTDIEIIEPEKRIENISKDLSDEPNEASLEVYNLNPDTRTAIKEAADWNAPIEIGISPLGSPTAITVFKGEIETVVNRASRPGFVTQIRALSQKRVHRAAYVTGKTYTAGTPQADIVQDFVDEIGLPFEIDTIPTTGIRIAHSFSGPVFPILQKFVSNFGMICYINDGVLKITNIYDPPNPTVIEITEAMLITEPQEMTRMDARETEIQTITEMKSITPSRKQNRRHKRKARKKETWKKITDDDLVQNYGRTKDTGISGDYLEVEVVDIAVPGIELECFAIPNLAPDHLITLDGGQTHYRVFETELSGDDLRGGERPTMRIRADRFEGDPLEGRSRKQLLAELEALG